MASPEAQGAGAESATQLPVNALGSPSGKAPRLNDRHNGRLQVRAMYALSEADCVGGGRPDL
eukprot:3429028-Lingulodinium_polyedra.AAC.2